MVIAMRDTTLALQVLQQQLLSGINPGDAPSPKRNRRQRVFDHKATGRATLLELLLKRVDFITNMMEPTALCDELVQVRTLPCRLDEFHRWSIRPTTSHKRYAGFLKGIVNNIFVPVGSQ